MSVERVAALAAFVLVAAGLALGFAATGPPPHMRLVELDRRRIDDLQTIEFQLRDAVAEQRGGGARLPARARDTWPRDPATGAPYEYQRYSTTMYRLCATFALASAPGDAPPHWGHPAGRACYRLSVDADPAVPEPILSAGVRL